MKATVILELASLLSMSMVDKMAHALGWPDEYGLQLGRPMGGVKWDKPFRNYYCGTAADPDWTAARTLGLAEITAHPREGYPDTTWAVTELGRQVVRLRLEATRRAFVASRPPKASKVREASP